MNKIPRWVEKETECNFCREMMEVKRIDIEGDDVNVIYVCHNPKCYHKKLFELEHEFVVIYHERKKIYNKFLNESNVNKAPDGNSQFAWK